MIQPRKFLINFTKFLIESNINIHILTQSNLCLLETKLKKYFKRFKNSWWMNSWLFNSGWNDKWKFETNRRLLSYSRLKNFIKKINF